MTDDVNTIECPTCGGAGDLSERRQVERIVAQILDLGTPLRPGGTPALGELTGGLAGRAPRAWGHDALDRCEATNKVIRAAGLDPQVWGICPTCKGDGKLPADSLGNTGGTDAN